MADWVRSLNAKRRLDSGLQRLLRVSLKRNHMDLVEKGRAYFGCKDRGFGLF